MLIKLRQLDICNPPKEIGKERIPVHVSETWILIEEDEIVAVRKYAEHPVIYLSTEEMRCETAVIEYTGKVEMCTVWIKDGGKAANIVLTDELLAILKKKQDPKQRRKSLITDNL